MNVYKITDSTATYGGGMALVAANNEQEAIDVFDYDTCLHNLINYDVSNYYSSLLEHIVCKSNEPYIITEAWYYE